MAARRWAAALVLVGASASAGRATPPPFPRCGADGTWCVAFSPFDDVTAALVGTISAAKKSVVVAVFNISSAEVTDALIERAHAGVDVTVLIDFARPDNAAIKRLRADGAVHFARIPSLRGGGPQMHEKLVLVDDDWLVVATGNLTEAALVSSAESWFATRDHSVVAAARKELDALVARAKAACSVFGRRSAQCPWGDVTWDAPFLAYAQTGKFRGFDVVFGPHCASFVAGKERIEAWPVDRSRADLACLRDPRFAELARLVAKARPLPSPVARALDAVVGRVASVDDPAPAPVRWLSSHDVDVEELLLASFARPRADPWAYVSLSRFHDKALVEAVAGAAARGMRVRAAVGAFLYKDAGGTDTGALLLDKLPDVEVVRDGFLSRGSLFHDKSAVIGDGAHAQLVLSSANWSAQAFTRSDEAFLLVDDPAIVAAFVEDVLRERALAGVDVTSDVQFLTARGFAAPRPVLLVTARVPAGVDAAGGGRIDLAGRAWPLRWDGRSPARLVGAVPGDAAAGASGAVISAGSARVTVSLPTRPTVVSRVDVDIPAP